VLNAELITLTSPTVFHRPQHTVRPQKTLHLTSKNYEKKPKRKGSNKKEAQLDLANKSGRNNQAIAPQKTPPKKTGTTTSQQREKTPKNNHDKEQSKLLTPPAKSKTP